MIECGVSLTIPLPIIDPLLVSLISSDLHPSYLRTWSTRTPSVAVAPSTVTSLPRLLLLPHPLLLHSLITLLCLPSSGKGEVVSASASREEKAEVEANAFACGQDSRSCP